MDEDIEALLAGLSDDEPRVTASQPAPAPKGAAAAPNRSAQLDGEITALAAELERLYTPRAPKLRELGLAPQVLASIVRVLGNEPAAAARGDADPLAAVVGAPRALAVRLCLAEDGGVALAADAWREIDETASRIAALDAEREALLARAAAELSETAPNLARVVDARVAARLLAQAGSLRQLAATSPANIVSLRSSPLLGEPLVDEVPAQFRKQTLRIVASKVVLAARMDCAGTGADALQGQLWRRHIEARVEKLLAAPPSLQHRALPKPVDKKTSRRGGKRVRKMKEKQAPSKLAREQNYIPFGA